MSVGLYPIDLEDNLNNTFSSMSVGLYPIDLKETRVGLNLAT